MGTLAAEPGAAGIPWQMLVTSLWECWGEKNNLNFTKAGAFSFGRGAFLGSGIRSFAWALSILRRNLTDEGQGSFLQLLSPKRWE